ncbi:hypothetical protein HWC08_gp114 [Lactobacillus phage 521B]|uniref:Uncharacterized protein n=1 Tax=Lactobacillus phage 521B TaxID=2510942 RepID=A0A4Y5FGC6_9CAUD|nr:hypothetical protein HWC08_gp114 [Lactobacillus phage 521B]QBJ03527.1 hypothetical protein B521_0177 [Lactobacillus phage 521B]
MNFIVGIKSLDLEILNNVLYKNKKFHVFMSYNYKDFLLSIENIKDTISLGDIVIIYNNFPMNSYNDDLKSINNIAEIKYFSNWHNSTEINDNPSDAFNDMLIYLNENKELSDEEVYEISKYKKENSGITNQMALLQYGIGLPIMNEKGLEQWKTYSSYITASNMVAAKRLINKENTIYSKEFGYVIINNNNELVPYLEEVTKRNNMSLINLSVVENSIEVMVCTTIPETCKRISDKLFYSEDSPYYINENKSVYFIDGTVKDIKRAIKQLLDKKD